MSIVRPFAPLAAQVLRPRRKVVRIGADTGVGAIATPARVVIQRQ